MRLDVNASATINKTELKTGMQTLGINITRDEFEAFWKAIFASRKVVKSSGASRDESISQKKKPLIQEINYLDLINAFVQAGCIKLEKSTDKLATLMSKYRQQLKKLNMTPEKAYKMYDEQDLRFVFKNDFVDISMAHGFDFS